MIENKYDLLNLLRSVSEGEIAPEEAIHKLKLSPFEDLGYAKVDYHRSIRQGMAEVIYGAGKTPEQIAGILKAMNEKQCKNILITRIPQDTARYLQEIPIPLTYDPISGLGVAYPADHPAVGNIVVASAGTSDMKVSEEAAVTAEIMGNKVTRLYDVGVSGLHRLLANLDVLVDARCVIAVAGMEGALASVLGGLVDCPLIAVPTSVGYGANFGGLSALLAMLNSCASGSSVVNIDNGFGAGYLASMINQMEGIKK